MEYARLVKVTPPSNAGNAEPVVYVVATQDPDEAMKLVLEKVIFGSDMEVIGRVSTHSPCRVLLNVSGAYQAECGRRIRARHAAETHPSGRNRRLNHRARFRPGAPAVPVAYFWRSL